LTVGIEVGNLIGVIEAIELEEVSRIRLRAPATAGVPATPALG